MLQHTIRYETTRHSMTQHSATQHMLGCSINTGRRPVRYPRIPLISRYTSDVVTKSMDIYRTVLASSRNPRKYSFRQPFRPLTPQDRMYQGNLSEPIAAHLAYNQSLFLGAFRSRPSCFFCCSEQSETTCVNSM